jgi:hemolysin activation/secretion protein
MPATVNSGFQRIVRKRVNLTLIGLAAAILYATPHYAAAATLPGSADAGRVDIDHKKAIPDNAPNEEEMPRVLVPSAKVPAGAAKARFTLKKVVVKGVTVFSSEEIEPLYSEFQGKSVGLDTIWKIADRITQHYQDKGYFLSRAYVPAQKIDGTVEIRVVEGYVGQVDLNDPVAENHIIQTLIARLKANRPARTKDLEELLLRLNDLPGVSFTSTIEPLKNGGKHEGAVELILVKKAKKGLGSVSFDNYNSRYLGPFEQSASYSTSIIPFEQTSISGLVADPVQKMKYFNASHTVPLSPEISVQAYGGYTNANPGFTLKPKDIASDATSLGLALKDQVIRQRDENLSGTLTFDAKNNYSDVLEAPLTRDRVRAARLNVAYDRADPFAGYEFLNLTFSQGLQVLDASEDGQKFLSRAGANPDFQKYEISLTRFQTLGESFTAVTSMTGQLASGVLYSSEQFGYGGQAFGRAYDPSEFIGDNGMAGSIELRYLGLPSVFDTTFSPFSFYDIGKVWNADSTPSASGASAGGGIRFESLFGFSGIFTVAEPLTHRLDDPSSGNGKTPRYLIQMTYTM